jgi:ABC-type maltose transport system permease subunit
VDTLAACASRIWGGCDEQLSRMAAPWLFGSHRPGTALAMLPPAVLFLALQKEFISGLTSGAVKG